MNLEDYNSDDHDESEQEAKRLREKQEIEAFDRIHFPENYVPPTDDDNDAAAAPSVASMEAHKETPRVQRQSKRDPNDPRQQIIFNVFNELGLGPRLGLSFIYPGGNDLQVMVFLDDCCLANILLYGGNNDNLHITQISKCEHVSGTVILDKIEEFARIIGVKKITLGDDSKIIVPECNIKISLAVLYFLSHGMTWYNSKGYLADTHHEYTNQISKDEINISMNEFIPKVIHKLRGEIDYIRLNKYHNLGHLDYNEFGNPAILQTDEKYVDYIYDLLKRIQIRRRDLTLDLLVKDYFGRVKTILQTPTPTPEDCKLFKLFSELFGFIEMVLERVSPTFNRHVTKSLNQDEIEEVEEFKKDEGSVQQQQQQQQSTPLKPLSRASVSKYKKNTLRKKLGYFLPKLGGKRTRKLKKKGRRTRRRKTKIFSTKYKKSRQFI